MNSNKSFHLRWNNHLSNLRTLLEYLYNEQSFVDVTLSCSDGLIRAHKLVLSACSPYFDTIFRENPCKHPTVILRGISLREMQLVIEYMYVGAVDIPENELSGLLEIANELHIKGLIQDTVDDDEMPERRESPTNSSIVQEFKNEENVEHEVKGSFGSINFTTDNLVKENDTKLTFKEEEKFVNHKANEENDEPVCGIIGMAQVKMDEGVNITEDGKNQLDNYRYEYTGNEERNCYPAELYCTTCNRGFISKQNMKRHMQTHSGLKPHQCNYCSLSFLRLSHLQRHHRVHTGERPFSCDQCDKQFSRSDKLKQHIAQHHSGVVVPKQPKQRGRPRKATVNIPLNLPTSPNRKISTENVKNIDDIATYQTLQQIYNISSTINGISVVQ